MSTDCAGHCWVINTKEFFKEE